MIARGDLGVELPPEQVPHVQRRGIRMARERGKLTVVATQMLMSMTNHARPTHAEVSDVANAVFDGADAVMLSEETAAGQFPVRAVETMSALASSAEDAPEAFRSPDFVDTFGRATRGPSVERRWSPPTRFAPTPSSATRTSASGHGWCPIGVRAAW